MYLPMQRALQRNGSRCRDYAGTRGTVALGRELQHDTIAWRLTRILRVVSVVPTPPVDALLLTTSDVPW
ncbi:hypothetical protein A0H81_02856 [Grifola frondosa]|uniref:Uncharacterized protein n=1 Tax=Grifola frondosa TaxID=5627 RepID=A0A1C7MSN0_GRIFR|nr:hypothetical protein A0H81_02856 [Grifola frondosa]